MALVERLPHGVLWLALPVANLETRDRLPEARTIAVVAAS